MKAKKHETLQDWGDHAEDTEVLLAVPDQNLTKSAPITPSPEAGRYIAPPWPEIPSDLAGCLQLTTKMGNVNPPRDRAQRESFLRWMKTLKARAFSLQQSPAAPVIDANAHAATTSARLNANSVVAAAAYANTLRERIKARSAKSNRK